ncbi:connector enhancer of kinase suppressor of ras 1 [Bombina bombina]|uniref:connector enhancer of kinase suppressor of ras 1 n=1 Tax=Bombina bombina TaxID=8345 RepID=UPI00235A78BD|nr:connector enhancer of kinase suppressor of ras 1 [Bombina bombina]
MEPVTSWSPEIVRGYLNGLDDSLHHYPFQEWDINGQELLGLSPQSLEQLGVRCIGHQEIILEAVEHLCVLHYELNSENLRTLTEKLWGVSQNLRSHIQSHKKASKHSTTTTLLPSLKQLVCIIDIVSASRCLFSWLNRYLFTRLNDYSASRDVIALCLELAEALYKDWSDPKIEERILSICLNICGICENILSCSPEKLLSQTATLEPLQIQLEPPHYTLGIEIKSTCSGHHYINGILDESPAAGYGGIFPGDEIIQVNGQVVVGWTRKNLVTKIRENTDSVSLILKKVSVLSSSAATASFKKHRSSTSPRSSHSSPSSPAGNSAPFFLTGPNIHITKKSHRESISKTTCSAPTTPTEYKDILSDSCALTAQAECKSSTSPSTLSGTPVLPSTLSFQKSQKKVLSPKYFWTYHGSSTNRKCHVSSIFPTSPFTQSSPEPVTHNLEPTSPTFPSYAGTLIPDIQLESSLTHMQQSKKSSKFISRSRTGSDTTSEPTSSNILHLPHSLGILRPALSDSSLLKSANSAVPERPKESQHGTSDHSGLEQENNISKSPNTGNKFHSPDSKNHKQRGKETVTRNQKGAVTKLSRRRVSCKDLGTPDCDGWLWKRKENVGFMSQKWKRCWCVLKKDRLYWYNVPQDDKALGLVNISLYKLESTKDPKKKYEFQLCHQTYKPFVFAADSLTDMSKWVTCLLASVKKHKPSPSVGNQKEEECYSETEDEDQFRGQRQVEKLMIQPQAKTVPETESPSLKDDIGAAELGQASGPIKAQPEDDSLESLISCLKQGGVSLIGAKTTMTRDEYRKSFIKRNKNPDINRRAHSLRALQSTLKAKESELEALNQVLDNPYLTSALFQKWKYEHEQLYDNIGKARGDEKVTSPKQERRTDSADSLERELDRGGREESDASD